MHAERLCRDENCDLLGLHAEHEVPEQVCEAEADQTDFPLEFAYWAKWHQARDAAKLRLVPPWMQQAPEALDDSIIKATSQTYPKPFEVIMRDVEYDYGSCNMRTVQRRLRAIVQRGHVIRLDLGRRLHAYVRPGSNMINDLDLVREQIISMTAG
jgi:hypothetical protein